MKAQSAIEFLTTYGFLFIILGVTLSVLAFFVAYPKTVLPQQCISYSGPACITASVFSNSSAHLTLITIFLQNSEPVPINISSISTTVTGTSGTGVCTPTYVYPGQYTTCTIYLKLLTNTGTVVQTFYSLPAKFCNSALAYVNNNTCSYDNVTFSGYYFATAATSRGIVFSAQALQGPINSQNALYSATPTVPTGYTVVQNGDWAAIEAKGILAYALSAGYTGNTLGINYASFPSSVSSLSNQNVACSTPFNSTFSLAYTTLYLSTSNTVNMRITTDDMMAVYYKSSSSSTWSSAFSNNAWVSGTARTYTANVLLSSGYDNLAVLWSNICSTGEQALNISGLPS